MNRAEAAVLARAAKAAKQPPLAVRFWSKVKKGVDNECWPWIAAFRSNRKGQQYGAFWLDGRHQTAPRVALMLTGVEVGQDMEVCHRCDNPPCCNPAHLFVGTPQDNVDDKVAKRRQVRGTRVHTAKLTEDQVREIRAMRAPGETLKPGQAQVIAKQYGITAQYVSEILAYGAWREV